MADQTQHRIGRNRPPRVQITYDVEIGDAVEVKELPFVVGIMADLAGDTTQKKFKERKFTQIERENFDEVMENIGPTLSFTVPNKIDDKGQSVPIDLKFSALSDFGPMAIVNQVDKIRETFDRRSALNALLAKIYVNDDLATALNDVIRSSETDEDLKGQLAALLKKLG
jgi:type VI secretion system protein ImpB